MKIIKRLLAIHLPPERSAFLWGPRKVGKSFWITHTYPHAILIDLLKRDLFAEYASQPWLLRERHQDTRSLIMIDEIQMIPDLLHEVHWLIENKGISFLLTGSSARKLKRKGANMLGGRAWRYTMAPLSFMEVDEVDLEEIMIRGLLPPHYLSVDPIADIRSYIADYLKEEIAFEAAVQNSPSFSEFLKVAALTSGSLLNYTNVGRECGVKTNVVREYFQILEDTLLGFRIQPWRKTKKRRLIETEKFYLFDIGITNYLCKRKPKIETPEFGLSFEHYLLMELKAYQAYRNPEMEIRFWKTSTGYEVDFIVGEMELAIEVKGSKRVHEGDMRALRALQEEHTIKHTMIVSLEREPRRHGTIDILPWRMFLQKLWDGEWGV